MAHDDALMVGMFWGGMLVASVPILLTVGIVIYVLRKMLEERRREDGSQRPQQG